MPRARLYDRLCRMGLTRERPENQTPVRPAPLPETELAWERRASLTQRQLEARVQEDAVEGGVFGATDFVFRHDDLRVQRHPLSWAFLLDEAQTTRSLTGPETLPLLHRR